jgi:hypothetical protein
MKTLFSILLLTAMTLTAGELTGKWQGKFDITNSAGETSPDEAYMDLKVSGTAVTGTAGPNEGHQWTIKNGKLEDGKLTFEVAMDEGGVIAFDLTFDGETVRGTATGTGKDGEKMSAKVDLKRAS